CHIVKRDINSVCKSTSQIRTAPGSPCGNFRSPGALRTVEGAFDRLVRAVAVRNGRLIEYRVDKQRRTATNVPNAVDRRQNPVAITVLGSEFQVPAALLVIGDPDHAIVA